VTELKLPEELDEQAMHYALGLLDPDDRQAFAVRLQGESPLLRQAATAYQASLNLLASAVVPVTPPPALRERLVGRVAMEAAREAEQFELAVNTLAMGSVPLKPRDSLRERLLSRVEGHSDVRLALSDSDHILGEPSIPSGYGRVDDNRTRLPQDTGSLSAWLWACWRPVWNFLGTIFIRSVAPQPSANGLTFVRASEGTWRGIAPGVMAKLLSFDPVSRRATTVLRFAPGTSYAPHRHTAVEELYVLEGGCTIGGREMTVGDYHRAEAGTVHHDTSTDEGCLLLVISSPLNEMLQ
jgi:quercetin dioxygenase-like cupin family protein